METVSAIQTEIASECQNFRFSSTDSIKDLYDYLLQREYAEPLSLDHQMERKAVRSPSLRLRFGRRSDPDVPLIRRVSLHSLSRVKIESIENLIFLFCSLCHRKQENDIEDEVEQKPIRSPSMRLRFGRRNDPMMSLFNEVNFHLSCIASVKLLILFFVLLLCAFRKPWCSVMNHSLEKVREHHQFAFALVNEIHHCWKMKWEN